MRKKQKWRIALLYLLLCIGILAGCGQASAVPEDTEEPTAESSQIEEMPAQEKAEEAAEEEPLSPKGILVLDAGHQAAGNFEKEPIGPGAAESKYKVAGGTVGKVSGKPEYALTLEITQVLQKELEARGYRVVIVREQNEVDISNAERAQIANAIPADALLHIHANGSENTAANGIMTICQTPENTYNAALYADSYALSSYILDAAVAETGARKEYVWETDSMSGINWATVPASIIEVGYLTNPQEEQLLLTAEYQSKLAKGIADGVDAYFAEKTADAADAQGQQ